MPVCKRSSVCSKKSTDLRRMALPQAKRKAHARGSCARDRGRVITAHRWHPCCPFYFKMLTARAITKPMMMRQAKA